VTVGSKGKIAKRGVQKKEEKKGGGRGTKKQSEIGGGARTEHHRVRVIGHSVIRAVFTRGGNQALQSDACRTASKKKKGA